MTDKSVANVDLGHVHKRWGISTLGTTNISIYKLKQKTSKLLLHLNKSQTEAELVISLQKIWIHPFKKPCIIETDQDVHKDRQATILKGSHHFVSFIYFYTHPDTYKD